MVDENSNLLLPKASILGGSDHMLTLVILPTQTFSSGDAIQYADKVPSFVSRIYFMILYYELGIDILLCSVKSVFSTCEKTREVHLLVPGLEEGRSPRSSPNIRFLSRSSPGYTALPNLGSQKFSSPASAPPYQ